MKSDKDNSRDNAIWRGGSREEDRVFKNCRIIQKTPEAEEDEGINDLKGHKQYEEELKALI